MTRECHAERGQVLLMVATGILFVMLGATALALDWGNGLLQERRLQTTADAAALAAADVLSKTGDVTAAVTAAQTIVSDNTNGLVALSATPAGTGTGLTDGIEIDAFKRDVRVALSRNVNTFFAPVLGINQVVVSVRSRAIVGPYGVMPITVKRFTAGDTSVSLSDPSQPSDILDIVTPAKDSYGNWRYLSGSWPPLTADPIPSAGYSHPDSYNAAVSGPIVALVGQNALANTANSADFHFFVAPDVRDLTHPSPTFYNGVALPDDSLSSLQQIKNITSGYILAGGYPGPNPQVGEQLGTFSGASTDQAVEAMRQVFKRGDTFTAMVYDGTVYRKPAFNLNLDAPMKTADSINVAPPPPDLPAEGIEFTVLVSSVNNFSSASVQFEVIGLEGWADWQLGGAALNTPYATAVPISGVSIPLKITAITEVQGARTALVTAYDPGTGTSRTVTATVVVGDDELFSVSSGEPFKSVEKGSATSFDVDLRGWHSYPNSNITVSFDGWFNIASPLTSSPGPGSFSVGYSPNATVQVKNDQNKTVKVNVGTNSTTSTGQWLMKIRATDGDSGRDQHIYLALLIKAPESNPTASLTSSFVNVLGYANFVITYANNATWSPSLDSNTIYGYAVSGLVDDPILLQTGLKARLVGWNQTW